VIATSIANFVNLEDVIPIVYLRTALSVIFTLFLPGFMLVKTLFPVKMPIETSSTYLDNLERLVLSLGLSLIITSMIALVLNYTPWGIRVLSLTLTLLALTVILATAGLLRQLNNQQG
jgi:uncharacterized membrane protein